METASLCSVSTASRLACISDPTRGGERPFEDVAPKSFVTSVRCGKGTHSTCTALPKFIPPRTRSQKEAVAPIEQMSGDEAEFGEDYACSSTVPSFSPVYSSGGGIVEDDKEEEKN